MDEALLKLATEVPAMAAGLLVLAWFALRVIDRVLDVGAMRRNQERLIEAADVALRHSDALSELVKDKCNAILTKLERQDGKRA